MVPNQQQFKINFPASGFAANLYQIPTESGVNFHTYFDNMYSSFLYNFFVNEHFNVILGFDYNFRV